MRVVLNTMPNFFDHFLRLLAVGLGAQEAEDKRKQRNKSEYSHDGEIMPMADIN